MSTYENVLECLKRRARQHLAALDQHVMAFADTLTTEQKMEFTIWLNEGRRLLQSDPIPSAEEIERDYLAAGEDRMRPTRLRRLALVHKLPGTYVQESGRGWNESPAPHRVGDRGSATEEVADQETSAPSPARPHAGANAATPSDGAA